MNYLDDLFHWISERESIRLKKEAGEPRPWTKDPILDTYRFCNVHREDDRVTRWIHDNWLRPHWNAPNIAFAMGIARMVNLPETLEELGFPHVWSPNQFIVTLADRKKANLKVWTSAYMITGGFSKGGESKEIIIARVLDSLYEQLKTNPLYPSDTLAEMAQKIKVPGIGMFLSAQIVADLKWHPAWRHAKDWWVWCAPGPGSQMGLNFLHGREPSWGIPEKQFVAEVNEIRHLIMSSGVELDAQNTQNCLCEFSKYVRAKHFNRRLKTTYVPQ